VLISGGVKVALAAVERAVREQPGLDDAIVVAVPDERWGEAPVAATASRSADTDAASAAVAQELGVAARPRIVHLDALPLLASGKPDRLAIRAAVLALLEEGL
jgi:O-succinylbenzoic acid--CoA ligase